MTKNDGCIALHLQLEQRHELLVIEVFRKRVCARSHHHVTVVIDQADREENYDELPLDIFKSFIQRVASFQRLFFHF